MTNGVLAQLDDLERRLGSLHSELQELRATRARARAARARAPPPAAAGGRGRQPARRPAGAAASPRPASRSRRASRPRWDREMTLPKVELADLLGARALAWAGGIVTLLGVVFFFVLAVNRGWIGPVERVGLGALASLLLFGGGLLDAAPLRAAVLGGVRRRRGDRRRLRDAARGGRAVRARARPGGARDRGRDRRARHRGLARVELRDGRLARPRRRDARAARGRVRRRDHTLGHGLRRHSSSRARPSSRSAAGWDVLLAAGAAAAIPQVVWLAARGRRRMRPPPTSPWSRVLLAARCSRPDSPAVRRGTARPESLSTGLSSPRSLARPGSRLACALRGRASPASTAEGVALRRRRRDLPRARRRLVRARPRPLGAARRDRPRGRRRRHRRSCSAGHARRRLRGRGRAARLGRLPPRRAALRLPLARLPRARGRAHARPRRDRRASCSSPPTISAPTRPSRRVAGLASLIVAFYAPRWKRLGGERARRLDRRARRRASSPPAARSRSSALGAGATLLVHAASLGPARGGCRRRLVRLGRSRRHRALGRRRRGRARRRPPLGRGGALRARLGGRRGREARRLRRDAADRPAGRRLRARARRGAAPRRRSSGAAPVAFGLPPVAAVLAGGGRSPWRGSATTEGFLLLAVAAPFAALAALSYYGR